MPYGSPYPEILNRNNKGSSAGGGAGGEKEEAQGELSISPETSTEISMHCFSHIRLWLG